MKILYHHRIASKDGQYVHIEEMTEALKRAGHSLLVVGPGVVESGHFGSDGGFVSRLKRHVPGAAYELLELGYSVYACFRLRRAIKRFKPDCLYERYNLYMLAGIWMKRLYGLPMLLEINAPLFRERSRYEGISLPRLARWSECKAWNGADMVLPVTRVLADMVGECGVPDSAMQVIHNGINKDRFELAGKDGRMRAELGLEGKLVLGFTGFVREWHRLDRVVDLLKQDGSGQERHMLLVGDGPARRQIEQRASELGLSSAVTVTGIVERDRIADYVSCFDIALQPDVVEYASPLKMFEYLALGRAIVAPDTANIREILQHDYNALLFDPGSEDGFLDAVERLCEEDGLRERLGRCAMQTINERDFTWDANARCVERLFSRLLSAEQLPTERPGKNA